MENYKKIIAVILFIAVAWHIKIALTPKIKLAGLFIAKPAELGYAWKDSKTTDAHFFWQDTDVKWQQGLLHPDFKAWSDYGEGLWIPITGYKFIYNGDTFVATVWDPGKKYDDLKVIAGQTQDSYIPFPGYKFIDINTSLKVVWTPGLVNSDNHRLIAGNKEGSWEVNYKNSPSNSVGKAFATELAKRAAWSLF